MYLWQERVEQLIRRKLEAQKALWLKDFTRKELLGAAFTFSKRGSSFTTTPTPSARTRRAVFACCCPWRRFVI